MRGVNAAVVGLLGAALCSPVWTSSVRAPGDVGIASRICAAHGLARAASDRSCDQRAWRHSCLRLRAHSSEVAGEGGSGKPFGLPGAAPLRWKRRPGGTARSALASCIMPHYPVRSRIQRSVVRPLSPKTRNASVTCAGKNVKRKRGLIATAHKTYTALSPTAAKASPIDKIIPSGVTG